MPVLKVADENCKLIASHAADPDGSSFKGCKSPSNGLQNMIADIVSERVIDFFNWSTSAPSNAVRRSDGRSRYRLLQFLLKQIAIR